MQLISKMLRLDGVSNPMTESDHPESITPPKSESVTLPPTAPLGARGDCHPACPVANFGFSGLLSVGLGWFRVFLGVWCKVKIVVCEGLCEGWCRVHLGFRFYLGLV